MSKHIDKIAKAADALLPKGKERVRLFDAISEIAKRGIEHERQMERIKGDIERGARAGKGRFRL